MLVEDLMTREVETCGPDASLAEAAGVMWRRDCGVVPVVGDDGRLVGMITDRDICMALATRHEYATDVRVSEVMARDLKTCTPVDDVREALEAMQRGQLRRIPVVDGGGRLAGILAVSDILRRTQKGKGKKRVARKDALATLKAIHKPRGGDEETTDVNRQPSTVNREGGDAAAASAPVDESGAANE